MNPPTPRKQLLVMESDLNRAHLAQEWRRLAQGVRSLAGPAGPVHLLVPAVVSWLADRVVGGGKTPAPAPGRKLWWQGILQGVQLAGSLWSIVQLSGRNQPGKTDGK